MIDEIAAAFLGGAVASATKVASKAVEDAYNGAKNLLVGAFGEKSEVVQALAKLESSPESAGRKAVAVEELQAIDVEAVPNLSENVRQLKIALEELSAENRANIQQATGSFIAQATNQSVAKVNIVR